MAKCVYSLVLDDEVIAQVDHAAYAIGTNRSGMINQILADYFSFMTPEKRIRSTFEEVEKWMEAVSGFRLQLLPSESALSIQSALSFKYNPVIRYTVELYRDAQPVAGEMRVGFRTQNRQLIDAFHSFLSIWVQMEEAYIGKYFVNHQIPYRIENGRYCRIFTTPSNQEDSRQLGKAIAQYVRMFDAVLKMYFSHISHPAVLEYTEDAYQTCLKQMDYIL